MLNFQETTLGSTARRDSRYGLFDYQLPTSSATIYLDLAIVIPSAYSPKRSSHPLTEAGIPAIHDDHQRARITAGFKT